MARDDPYFSTGRRLDIFRFLKDGLSCASNTATCGNDIGVLASLAATHQAVTLSDRLFVGLSKIVEQTTVQQLAGRGPIAGFDLFLF